MRDWTHSACFYARTMGHGIAHCGYPTVSPGCHRRGVVIPVLAGRLRPEHLRGGRSPRRVGSIRTRALIRRREGGGGAQALLLAARPALVILGIWLEALEGGWHLQRELRRDPQIATIPALVCSANPALCQKMDIPGTVGASDPPPEALRRACLPSSASPITTKSSTKLQIGTHTTPHHRVIIHQQDANRKTRIGAVCSPPTISLPLRHDYPAIDWPTRPRGTQRTQGVGATPILPATTTSIVANRVAPLVRCPVAVDDADLQGGDMRPQRGNATGR